MKRTEDLYLVKTTMSWEHGAKWEDGSTTFFVTEEKGYEHKDYLTQQELIQQDAAKAKELGLLPQTPTKESLLSELKGPRRKVRCNIKGAIREKEEFIQQQKELVDDSDLLSTFSDPKIEQAFQELRGKDKVTEKEESTEYVQQLLVLLLLQGSRLFSKILRESY